MRLTRFVCRDGDAFAVYYAAYANNHPDSELAMLISLGEWAEDSDPAGRVAFYCRVRLTDDSYEVMLGDATASPWGDVDIVGKRLSRDEARHHAWKSTAFEVLDEAFSRDPSLRGFLDRVQAGDAAVPLEQSFAAPDDIFALSADERTQRADLGRNLASLDGARFFVRCLLPVPVEEYGTWCIGVWVEVAKPDYDRVRAAWDDPVQYPTLRFTGLIANDVGSIDLPIALDRTVQVHAPDPETPPQIAAPGDGALAEFLTKPWSRAAFEAYAVPRGIL